MFERFTAPATTLIFRAQSEARLMCHSYIGTEQLLLGMLGQEKGKARLILNSRGVYLESARRETQKIIGFGTVESAIETPFTPKLKIALKLALGTADSHRHSYVNVTHILFALIQDRDNLCCRVLDQLKVDIEDLQNLIESTFGPPSADFDFVAAHLKRSSEERLLFLIDECQRNIVAMQERGFSDLANDETEKQSRLERQITELKDKGEKGFKLSEFPFDWAEEET